MVIDFRCPACAASQSVPEHRAGRQTRCHACNTVFMVPSTLPRLPPLPSLPPLPPAFTPPPDAIMVTAAEEEIRRDPSGRFPHRIVYSTAGGVIGLLLLVWLVIAVARSDSDGSLGAQQIYDKYSPAVVQLLVFDIDGDPVSRGSGFFVSPEGGLVTNRHVVDVAGAEFYKVVREGESGGQIADFIVWHRDLDLAYLKIREPTREYLELTPKLPEIGQNVYAIGNPRGLTNTISPGIVSGLRERPDGHTEIQFTAPISPGSSGGPLFNDRGQVIGVTSAFITGGQNLNLATPVEAVVRLVEEDQ